MEKLNLPVISMMFGNRAPGADIEVFERFRRWTLEVYNPLQLKATGLKGIDNYQVVRESLEYPSYGLIFHFENWQAWENFAKAPEFAAIQREAVVWVKRGVRDPVWSSAYELVKSYRSEPLTPGKPDTRIENAPVISLEAFLLSTEDEEKYVAWFTEYGNSFIPLFLRLPGFKGCDWYKYAGSRSIRDVREQDYPKYLSIFYFENTQSFDNFVKSPELAAFLKIMRSVFPHGLRYDWYVQYQLVKSLRK